MIHLDLTAEEITILLDMLDTCISDLRTEIADTDNRDYKQMLKNREAILKKMLVEVQQASQAA